MIPLGELRRICVSRLKDTDDCADFDTDLIIEYATGIPMGQFAAKADAPVDEDAVYRLINRRMDGEPTQYILGKWEFYGLDFFVGEGVLIPRPDTETLVETALGILKGKENPRVLDLCSGSGCVAIAIKHFCPSATVTAVEYYDEAAEYLKRNAALNGADIAVVRADALDRPALTGKYDLIVSNPPYISRAEMDTLQKEVQREPHTALFGGEDGLDFYRAIAGRWTELLADGGCLAVEIGYSQAKSVCEIFEKNRLSHTVVHDLSGNDRVIFGILSSL